MFVSFSESIGWKHFVEMTQPRAVLQRAIIGATRYRVRPRVQAGPRGNRLRAPRRPVRQRALQLAEGQESRF
jgi:hypothetical protein